MYVPILLVWKFEPESNNVQGMFKLVATLKGKSRANIRTSNRGNVFRSFIRLGLSAGANGRTTLKPKTLPKQYVKRGNATGNVTGNVGTGSGLWLREPTKVAGAESLYLKDIVPDVGTTDTVGKAVAGAAAAESRSSSEPATENGTWDLYGEYWEEGTFTRFGCE